MKINIGKVYNGKISGIQKYGIFITLPNGEEGLVHISEVRNEYISDLYFLYNIGDTVRVKAVKKVGEKYSLSMKDVKLEETLEDFDVPGGFNNLSIKIEKWTDITYEQIVKKLR